MSQNGLFLKKQGFHKQKLMGVFSKKENTKTRKTMQPSNRTAIFEPTEGFAKVPKKNSLAPLQRRTHLIQLIIRQLVAPRLSHVVEQIVHLDVAQGRVGGHRLAAVGHAVDHDGIGQPPPDHARQIGSICREVVRTRQRRYQCAEACARIAVAVGAMHRVQAFAFLVPIGLALRGAVRGTDAKCEQYFFVEKNHVLKKITRSGISNAP
jgi:hypothetical protein